MIIKIESGANVQITDKPIINVSGNIVQHNEVHIHPEVINQDVQDAEIVEKVKNDEEQKSSVAEINPIEAFVEQVKRIMLFAEKKNGQEMTLTARGNGGIYIYNVDGKGFCKVMDLLVGKYTPFIEDYLNGASAENAGSIKYVCPFVGYVLDTHLYSEKKLQKSDLKFVMEEVYGKGTSAISKMSNKNVSHEAQTLFEIVKEIMKNAAKA